MNLIQKLIEARFAFAEYPSVNFISLLSGYCLGIALFSPSANAEIIYETNFDDGNFDRLYRQYQSAICSSSSEHLNNSLFKFVDSPVRGGSKALRHTIQNCDERTEVGIPSSKMQKNNEYWIGWSYFFPQDFHSSAGTKDTTVIQQMFYGASFLDQRYGDALFTCNRDVGGRTMGVPGSYMTINPNGDNFNYTIATYEGNINGKKIFGCKRFTFPAELDEWEDFVMNVKPSDDSDVGFVKIYKDGELVVDERVAIMPPDRNTMGAWKIGAYVGNPGHGERVLYTDELRLGDSNSSFEEVSPKFLSSPSFSVNQ